MSRPRWSDLENIYHAALPLDPDRRAEFLREACAGDPDLLGEVQSLLTAENAAGDFLETPAMRVMAQCLAQDPGFYTLDLAPGHVISHYRLLRKLGQGGLGIVFSAE